MNIDFKTYSMIMEQLTLVLDFKKLRGILAFSSNGYYFAIQPS